MSKIWVRSGFDSFHSLSSNYVLPYASSAPVLSTVTAVLLFLIVCIRSRRKKYKDLRNLPKTDEIQVASSNVLKMKYGMLWEKFLICFECWIKSESEVVELTGRLKELEGTHGQCTDDVGRLRKLEQQLFCDRNDAYEIACSPPSNLQIEIIEEQALSDFPEAAADSLIRKMSCPDLSLIIETTHNIIMIPRDERDDGAKKITFVKLVSLKEKKSSVERSRVILRNSIEVPYPKNKEPTKYALQIARKCFHKLRQNPVKNHHAGNDEESRSND